MQGRWAILRLMIECGAAEIFVSANNAGAGLMIHWRCAAQYDAGASSGQGSLLIHLKKDMLLAAKHAGRCEC
jgi:hypothetical protein